MSLFKQTSIRGKLTQILLLTASISIAIAVLGFSVSDWYFFKSSAYTELTLEAEALSRRVQNPLLHGDKDKASTILMRHRHPSVVTAIGLYDRNSQPFANSISDSFDLPATPLLVPKGNLKGHIYVQIPVSLDQQRLGSLLAIAKFDYWSKRYRTLLVTAFCLFAVTFFVIALFSRQLHRIVADPILQLTKTARRVTQNEDYSLRAEKLSADEIGWLVDDFNEMLNQIQFRDHILQRSREKLEDKVAERTRELTELTHQLEHQAYHDSLTGLANRITFDDHLKLAINQVDRYGGHVSVMFLDLDRFKIINDTLGHVVGDKLLINVANRFQRLMRDTDTLARLGGDEFAVLLMQPKGEPVNTEDIARRLINTIDESIYIDGYNLHITASIGISVYPQDGDSADVILKNADTAMYRSKDNGRNQFSFFSPDMNARALHRLKLETRLRRAVLFDKLQLFYQPRRDAKTLEIIGVEALIRWWDEELGEVSPSEFIPIAQDCGLSAMIDDWVLQKACTDTLTWFDGKSPHIALSVNFSATQFIRKDLINVVQAILEKTGFPGEKLELEITEDLFGPDTSNVLDVLDDLRKLNIEFSIDDFGKAYSSLARLKQLPLQTLKIDQSFVLDIPENQDDCVMVRTIITMGKSLGLQVVAEGIENRAQYDFVKHHGCDTVQGYLFGRPQSAEDLQALLEEELSLSQL